MAKKKKKVTEQMDDLVGGELVGVAVSVDPIIEKDSKRKNYNEGGEEIIDPDIKETMDNERLAIIQAQLLMIDQKKKNTTGLADIAKLEAEEKKLEAELNKLMANRTKKQTGGLLGDLDKDGELSGYEEKRQDAINKAMRDKKQEGGEMDSQMTMMMMPKKETKEMDMLPDDQMEDEHLNFIINESLDQEEKMYLMEKLQADDRLSMIFDKIMDTASEFSGSGPVEGLGTGVSDSIPARLSDGEFVMTAKATEEIGADNLQRMMEDAEEASDNRQRVAMGGELEKKVDKFGKPIDQDLADEEIKRSMLSVNPRLQ